MSPHTYARHPHRHVHIYLMHGHVRTHVQKHKIRIRAHPTETCSQCLFRWPGLPTIRNRVGNDWAIAVNDETLLDPIFNHLLQKVQGQGQSGSVDEVTIRNSQVLLRTRRRICVVQRLRAELSSIPQV